MDPQKDEQQSEQPKHHQPDQLAGSPHTPVTTPRRGALPLVLGALGLFVVMVLLATVLLRAPKTYGRVGSYRVTQAEVDRVAKENPSLSKDSIVTALLNLNLYRQAATTAGVKVSQEEVVTEVKNRVGKASVTYPNYLKNLVESDLLLQKLTERVPGNTQGRMVIINFNQHFLAFGSTDLGPGETEAQRPTLIAGDRTAADKLKDTIYSQLRSKAITFDQAVGLEKADPKLGEKALPTSVHSGTFNTQDKEGKLTGFLNSTNLKQVVDSVKAGEYSTPTLVKIRTSDNNPARIDGLWAIVQVDARPNKLADNLGTYLTDQKTKLRYEKKL